MLFVFRAEVLFELIVNYTLEISLICDLKVSYNLFGGNFDELLRA